MYLLLLGIAACACYAAAGLALGARLLGWLARDARGVQESSPAAWFATAFLLGQGVLANVWLLLALGGWFLPVWVFAGLALCLVLGAAPAWACTTAFARSLRTALAAWRAEPWPWFLLFLLVSAVVVLFAWAALVVALPSHNDGAAYYMAVAKWLAATGQLAPFPGYEGFSENGLQGELHFSALMLFGVEQEARAFVWPTVMCGLALLLALGTQAGLGRRGQWVALALVFSSTALTDRLTDGKVDGFGFAMGLAAFYWAWQYRGKGGASALRLAGLFTGLAAIAKLSLLAAVAPGVLLLLLWPGPDAAGGPPTRRGGILAAAGAGLLFALWCLPAAIPHFIKNGVFFGEPFSPLFFLSGLKTWITMPWFRPDQTPQVVATYPLLLVYGKIYSQGGSLSPLLLAFAPFVLTLPRPPRWAHSPLLRISAAVFVGLVLWVLVCPGVFAPRYLLPGLLLLSVPVAAGVEYVARAEPRPQGLSAFVLLVIALMMAAVLRGEDLRRVAGQTWQYLSVGRSLPDDKGVAGVLKVNELAGPGERVFFASGSRFWLRPDLLQCLDATVDSPAGRNPAELWAALFDRGFRYVVLDVRTHPAFGEGLGIRDFRPTGVPEWLEVAPVYTGDHNVVFRLSSRDPARHPAWTCRRVEGTRWAVVPAAREETPK